MEYYNDITKGFIVSRTQWFDIARQPDGRLTKVITVTSEESGYWIIAYAILVSMIFVAITKLVTSLVLTTFPLESRGNQYAMLVSFYNANSPTTAVSQTASYIRHALFNCRRGPRWAVDWPTVRSGLCLALLSLLMIGGSAAAKFLVSGKQLIVRRAARANPGAIFYPNLQSSTSNNNYILVQPVRAAAAYQALGRVSAAKAKIEQSVHVSSEATNTTDGPSLLFRWDYSVTGEDMGLQRAPHLTYSVSGQCQTRYDWLNTTLPNVDWYENFAPDPTMFDTASVDDERELPGWISILPKGNEANMSKINRGFEFAMVPNTSHRKSNFSNPDDIWYMTEENPKFGPSNATAKIKETQYQVRRGRPPLHCWQNDTWSMNGYTVYHVDRLADIPGLQLSTFIQVRVFRREFSSPIIMQVANLLGYSALESSLYSVANARMFSAQYANATRDLERLIQIGYVSTREVVRNLVLLYGSLADRADVSNLAKGPDGKVPSDTADFILESQNVAAMSVLTLIITPSVCVLLWIIVLFRGVTAHGRAKATNDGKVSQHNFRAIALQASQLYRYLDELANNGRPRWSGRTSMTPFIRDLPVREKTGEDGESPFVQPKLVRLDDPVENDNAPLLPTAADEKTPSAASIPTQPASPTIWSKLMFWRKPETPNARRYEIVMTRRWNPTEGREDGGKNHLTFEDVLKDLPL